MEYNFEFTSDTTAVLKTEKFMFLLDSGEKGLPEHALLLEDFKDKTKLERFISLLDKDHETAYTTYLSERK